MATFDLPAPRHLKSADKLDPVDRAILEAGYILNDEPRWFLPQPSRIGWCAWEWSVERGGRVVAQGRAWSQRAAFNRRWRAYLKADAKAVADKAHLRDRDAGELRTDGPVT